MNRDPGDKNPFDNERYRSKVGSTFGSDRYSDHRAGTMRGAGLLAIPVVVVIVLAITQCG